MFKLLEHTQGHARHMQSMFHLVLYALFHAHRVGQNHTNMGIYGVYTVILAGKSPHIRSYTVCIYGSDQPNTHSNSLPAFVTNSEQRISLRRPSWYPLSILSKTSFCGYTSEQRTTHLVWMVWMVWMVWCGRFLHIVSLYTHAQNPEHKAADRLDVPSLGICRVGQDHKYTVHIRYFWQGNHQIYGHIRCIYIRCWPTLGIWYLCL